MKIFVGYYALYLCKMVAISYILYRLGKKFGAQNPCWHYFVPVLNYIILCRCAGVPRYYAIGYHVAYFAGSIVQLFAENLRQPALINIWISLFFICIMLETEIFGRMALRLQKSFWYGLSGFLAYFPLIFLVLSKRQPVADDYKPSLPPRKSDYQVY